MSWWQCNLWNEDEVDLKTQHVSARYAASIMIWLLEWFQQHTVLNEISLKRVKMIFYNTTQNQIIKTYKYGYADHNNVQTL